MDLIEGGPVYQPQQPVQHTHQVVDASEVARVIWRRSWVIGLIMICSLGTAWYLSRHTKRVWRAEAQVMLIQRANSSNNGNDQVQGVLPPVVETIDTQIGLMQSSEMARRTIE